MHAETRERFTDLGAEALALAEQLEQAVAPAVWDRILRLTVVVDDFAANRMREVCDRDTAQVLAHFPGLAPAWWVVFGHLRGEAAPPCAPSGRLHPHCQLPPLEEPQ